MNRPEIVLQRPAHDLGDGAGQLDDGRPSACDHEVQPVAADRGAVDPLGCFEGVQNVVTDVLCFFSALQAGSSLVPVIVTVVPCLRPGGGDQVVVWKHAAVRKHDPLCGFVNVPHVSEQHLRILLLDGVEISAGDSEHRGHENSRQIS